jgi:hypothetical protein
MAYSERRKSRVRLPLSHSYPSLLEKGSGWLSSNTTSNSVPVGTVRQYLLCVRTAVSSVSDPDSIPDLDPDPEISCFEVLDILFWGLKASSAAWTSFMEA